MPVRLSEAAFNQLSGRRFKEKVANTKATNQKFVPRPEGIIFDSQLEETFFKCGKVLLEEFFDCKVKEFKYHPFTLWLPGNKYTPDFLAIMSNGITCVIETKGSKRSKNYRDSRSKLRAAAACFPFWVFVQVTGSAKVGLTLEEVKP